MPRQAGKEGKEGSGQELDSAALEDRLRSALDARLIGQDHAKLKVVEELVNRRDPDTAHYYHSDPLVFMFVGSVLSPS